MSRPARILLVTPEPVTIEPPTDQITACVGGPGNLSSDEFESFTHWATGPVCGPVASEMLMQAVNSAAPASTLFPLEGYEWISTLERAPALLRVIPGADAGSVVLSCGSLQSEAESAEDAIESATVGSQISLLKGLPFIGALRIVSSQVALGQPLQPFVPPRLVPTTQRGHPEPHIAAVLGTLPPQSAAASSALQAGIWQLNDNLDGSHSYAQSIEGHPDGDYWHAIMHRREPDYGNSKYWFRHVGRHPVFADLAPRAAEILNEAPSDIAREWALRLRVDAGWDPFAFVDMCQQAASDEDSDLGLAARRIQWIEMLLLLKHCARAP